MKLRIQAESKREGQLVVWIACLGEGAWTPAMDVAIL